MSGTRLRWLNPALYLVLAAIVLWPILSVPIPCLGDYINHLARIHVITSLDHSPGLQQFYDVRWNFTPYLGMDAVMYLLTLILPLYQAGSVFLMLCVLIPVAGAAALHKAAFGRVGLMPASAFLLSYNYVLSWGFLNYLFSAGLAVLLFAGWVATESWPRWRRAALFTAGLTLVYLGHVFAGAAYCIAVAGLEISRAVRTGFHPRRTVMLDWLAAASQSVPVIFLAARFNLHEVVPGASVTFYGNGLAKLRALLSPAIFPGAGGASLAAVAAALLLWLYLWRSRHLVLSPVIWPAAFAVTVVAALVPYTLFGLPYIDLRLPLVACILFIGCASLSRPLAASREIFLVTVLLCLVVAKSAGAASILRAMAPQVASIRRMVAAMPPGQRLLVLDIDDANAPLRVAPSSMTLNMPMVALIDRDAFTPILFTGMNIVHPRPAMALSSAPGTPPIGLAQLQEGLTRPDPPGAPAFFSIGARVYWYGWPKKFDYVLIMHFGDPTPGLPAILHRVASSPIADLYRIDPV